MTTSLTSNDLPTVPLETPTLASSSWPLRLSRLSRAWTDTIQQGLPLFRREMLVQSIRPRTYVIRAGFALTLFFVALVYTAATTGTSLFSAANRLPGQGRVILDGLVWMLFVFIYVFAPATASGVITLEKERQTLVLLYLTKLTPWHVVLEKYLSRLLPTLSILLLAMPLLVIAYTFGGVTVEMLGTAMWFLVVTAVQVTAVAVLCSTLCRRTTQAFLLTYGALALLYFGPVLADVWLLDGRTLYSSLSSRERWNTYQAQATAAATLGQTGPTMSNVPLEAIPKEAMLLACFPPLLFSIHYLPSMTSGQFVWETMLLAGYPALLSTILSLVLARCLVFFRAFEDERSPLLKRIQKLAGRLSTSYISERKRAAARAAQAIHDLPEDEPIAWRERSKSTGNWLPVLLLLVVPTITVILWLARTGNGQPESISAMIFIVWVLSVLLICVNSASLITKERNQQTLDLLLTTPLSSAEIIQQKFNGTRRLMLICAAPLLTCIAFQSWWRAILYVPPTNEPVGQDVVGFIWWEYLITAFSCVFIYFQLVGWIALWGGLRNKSATRATLDALGGVVACCFVPQVLLLLPLAVMIPVNFLLGVNLVFLIAAQLSPVLMIALTEFTNLRDICDIPLLPTIANSVIYGTMLHYVRKYVLDRADIYLGRTVHY